MNTFVAGVSVPVSWQQSGGGVVVLNITDHSVDISVLLIDVTHSGTGGNRARIAGPADAAGTVNLHLDLDAPPYSSVINVVPGVKGIAVFGVSLIKGIQVPMAVEKLHFASSMEKEVVWSTDMKMDALVGVLVFPPV